MREREGERGREGEVWVGSEGDGVRKVRRCMSTPILNF